MAPSLKSRANLLEEIGVWYTLDKNDSSGMTAFQYQWYAPKDERYINGGGQSGTNTVYIFGGKLAFLKLLLHWNCVGWLYKPAY